MPVRLDSYKCIREQIVRSITHAKKQVIGIVPPPPRRRTGCVNFCCGRKNFDRNSLTLGELEASSCLGSAVFFTLDDAAVAGKKATRFQHFSEIRLARDEAT